MGLSAGFWDFISNCVYGLLAGDAFWGAYCAVMVYLRIGQKQFRSEKKQDEFMGELLPALESGDFAAAAAHCEGDARALPQLALLACENRKLGVEKIQELLLDRFQRDVVSDIENRVNWVNNVIKTAPMLGLLGTVLGMMAAFGKLAAEKNVSPDKLANDISFALITTAIGLAITIPATICVANINNRMKKLESMVVSGMIELLDGIEAGEKALGKGS